MNPRKKKENAKNPPIFINCGDPNGIGPEIAVKAIAALAESHRQQMILCGSLNIILNINRQLGELLEFRKVQSIETIAEVNGIPVVEPESGRNYQVNYGKISAKAGAIAGEGITMGVRWCLEGKTGALVTAPSCKETLHKAGYIYPGQTEMIASLTGAKSHIMILKAGQMRVGLATTHLPLKDVAARINRDLIIEKLRVLKQTLTRWFGIDNPRIALASLNPHASDGGIFGKEEEIALSPAVQFCQKEGIAVVGPLAADTLFPRWRDFDAILALYHDQGMIPIKMAGFGRAVNMTGGLPFLRTSPDHGTAFDIAGRMVANEGSMKEAILTALEPEILTTSTGEE